MTNTVFILSPNHQEERLYGFNGESRTISRSFSVGNSAIAPQGPHHAGGTPEEIHTILTRWSRVNSGAKSIFWRAKHLMKRANLELIGGFFVLIGLVCLAYLAI